MARSEETYRMVFLNILIHIVLILDEWLLLKLTVNERKDIFELLSKRSLKLSTIFCAQYKPEDWYEQLGCSDEPLADAILD